MSIHPCWSPERLQFWHTSTSLPTSTPDLERLQQTAPEARVKSVVYCYASYSPRLSTSVLVAYLVCRYRTLSFHYVSLLEEEKPTVATWISLYSLPRLRTSWATNASVVTVSLSLQALYGRIREPKVMVLRNVSSVIGSLSIKVPWCK